MTVGPGLYLHPFDRRDLAARGGLRALADLGYGEASMAVAYHAGRWLTPQSAGAVRFLEDGTVHFRPNANGDALTPLASSEVPATGADPLRTFVAEAHAANLRPFAWTVLFHNTRLGVLHPASCVRNAFGDGYEYALCPARFEVRDYGVRVVRDIGSTAGLAGIELEAVGFLGYRHGSHHDKASFAIDRHLDALLSICFCDACTPGYAANGADADELRTRVTAAVRRRVHDACALTPPVVAAPDERLRDDITDAGMRAVLAHRLAVQRRVLTAMRAATPPGVTLFAHLQPDPWFTGSQLGQHPAAVADLLDGFVLTHYGEDVAKIERAWQSLDTCGREARIAIWPKSPPFTGAADLGRVASLAARRSAAVRVYHLGLLPWSTVATAAAALTGPTPNEGERG